MAAIALAVAKLGLTTLGQAATDRMQKYRGRQPPKVTLEADELARLQARAVLAYMADWLHRWGPTAARKIPDRPPDAAAVLSAVDVLLEAAAVNRATPLVKLAELVEARRHEPSTPPPAAVPVASRAELARRIRARRRRESRRK